MDVYTAKGQRLEYSVLSLLNRNSGQTHHTYQDKFYKFEISLNIARQKSESVQNYEG